MADRWTLGNAEGWQKVWRWIERRILTSKMSPADGLPYWRDRLFRMISLVAGIAGEIVLFREGRPLVGLFGLVVYLLLAAALLFRPFGNRLTALAALTGLFSIGVLHIFMRGTNSGGLAYLFAVPFLAGVLFNIPSTIVALLLVGVVYLVVGLCISQGLLPWAITAGLTAETWTSTSLNYLFINTLVAVSSVYLLNGIQQANKSQQAAMESLEREMAERLKAEQAATKALRQKEALLREVHHRVKNNLQMVNSLLRLQTRESGDPRLEQILAECRSRVVAMAMVHETLLRDSDQASVDLAAYVTGLAGELRQSLTSRGGALTLEAQADGVSLDLDQAVTCGLIINELLTNTGKHALAGRAAVRVRVVARRLADGRLELVVADDGPGPPKGFDPRRHGNLGLRLVVGMVEDQLRGDWSLDTSEGMKWVIRWDSSQA